MGKPLQQRSGVGSALPKRHDHIELLQPIGEKVLFRQVVMKNLDGGPTRQAAPIGRLERHTLVVVQQRDPYHSFFAASVRLVGNKALAFLR